MAEGGVKSLVDHWTQELSERIQAELGRAATPDAAATAAAWLRLGAERVGWHWRPEGGEPWAGSQAGAVELHAAGRCLGAAQVQSACGAARRAGVAALRVAACDLARAAAELRATPVRVGVAVGGPRGEELATVKRCAAAEALKLGADEIDLMPCWGAVAAGDESGWAGEIRPVAELCAAAGAALHLTLPEGADEAACVRLARWARQAGVEWLRWQAASVGALSPAGLANVGVAFGAWRAAPAAPAPPALPAGLTGVCLRRAEGWRA